MSFRNRLTVFFLLMVALPMVAVAALLIRTSGELSEGRAQASLNQAAKTSVSLYERESSALMLEAQELAKELEGYKAWKLEPATLVSLLRPTVGSERFRSITILGAGGKRITQIGPEGGLNSVRIRFTKSKSRIKGLLLADISAEGYLNRIADLTQTEAVFSEGGQLLASTLDGADSSLLSEGQITINSIPYQTINTDLGSRLHLTLLLEIEEVQPLESRPLLTIIFAGLLVGAVLFGVIASRQMHKQVDAMLGAAKRIGEGDFSARIPIPKGRFQKEDELVEFALQFNSMAGLIEDQFAQLQTQRQQLESSIRRLGQALSSGMDREAMLETALLMTIEACGADFGHLTPRGGKGVDVEEKELDAESSHPDLDELGHEILARIEREASESGEPMYVSSGRWHAMGRVLRHGETEAVMGLVRADREFEETEKEIFAYLTNQVAVSLENLKLMRMLEQQATSDELTRLANRRRFNQLIQAEMDRARRFKHPLSLLMIDIDDFKPINDTLGHPKGDEALKYLGRVLQESTRSVDEPARYGGEEFAILLPETDLEGAREIAERIRERVDKESTDPSFTVSIGVSEWPAVALDAEDLLKRADDALYEAKRTGKNKVVKAHE